jgi:hypothetical protein
LRHVFIHATILGMALRDDIQKRIDKKRVEIEALRSQIRDATVYVQALEDTLKILPRDAASEAAGVTTGLVLRTGSKVYRARQAIHAAGRPLHLVDLMAALRLPNKPKEKAALAGSLSSYARKGEIFTRPAPNTFGLIEQKGKSAPAPNGPPPNFGVDESVNVEDDLGDYGIDESQEETASVVVAK